MDHIQISEGHRCVTQADEDLFADVDMSVGAIAVKPGKAIS